MKEALMVGLFLLLTACTSDVPPAVNSTAEQAEQGGADKAATALHDRTIARLSTMTNSPPQIDRVKLMPEVFTPGDTLSVDVLASDRDHHEVTLQYEWTKNGEPAGNEQHISTPIKRGDKVSVKVTPFDGADYGPPLVLDREIVNLPPMLVQHDQYQFDGTLYTYQLQATDVDGDVLTFSLASGPTGMMVNTSTGLVTWNVPPEFTGKAAYRVAITDGHGGRAEQDFTLTLTPPSPQSSQRVTPE